MKLLKLGGSVITNKKGRCEANMGAIDSLAKAIAEVWNSGVHDIILVHGAGSFGHALVIEYKLHGGIKGDKGFEGYQKTQEACALLSSYVVSALQKYGVPAERIPPSDVIAQRNGRIVNFDEKRVFALLESGKMPVLHGDMVRDEAIGGSVCSGDQIIAYLAKKSQFTLIGTNVDGILADGKLVEKINKESLPTLAKHLKESDSPDVTGGMAGKVAELASVGGKIYIANALYPSRISAILMGKRALCTEMDL